MTHDEFYAVHAADSSGDNSNTSMDGATTSSLAKGSRTCGSAKVERPKCKAEWTCVQECRLSSSFDVVGSLHSRTAWQGTRKEVNNLL